MNNVNVLDNNGQSISIDLVCYFKSDNKNYLFYTKNEIVQDGLIKMYVSSEFNGTQALIVDDEWNKLKKIMQGIIMGNSDVTFLPYNNGIRINESRAIALNDKNINAIKDIYKKSSNVDTSLSGNLNKDLLTESFGGTNSSVEVPVTPEPVQISSIPNIQNSFNMESTPVNLNMETPVNLNTQPENNVNNELNNNPFNSVPNIEPIVNNGLETPKVPNEEPLNINSIKPSGIDSGFKVTSEPNIFDQPVAPINSFNITQEEINKPIENIETNVEQKSSNTNSSRDVSKQIALNERKIKLFEELANIYKEENELLSNFSNGELEKTASNLFNNNGTLNEFKVLED